MRVAMIVVACVTAFTLTGCFEGPKGDKGDKGDTGTTGPAGPAGSPGAPGKNFSILVNPANGTCPGADEVIVSALLTSNECHSHRWSCWATTGLRSVHLLAVQFRWFLFAQNHE